MVSKKDKIEFNSRLGAIAFYALYGFVFASVFSFGLFGIFGIIVGTAIGYIGTEPK